MQRTEDCRKGMETTKRKGWRSGRNRGTGRLEGRQGGEIKPCVAEKSSSAAKRLRGRREAEARVELGQKGQDKALATAFSAPGTELCCW